jgi:hypothetical protein
MPQVYPTDQAMRVATNNPYLPLCFDRRFFYVDCVSNREMQVITRKREQLAAGILSLSPSAITGHSIRP